jgi:hypothetical protein
MGSTGEKKPGSGGQKPEAVGRWVGSGYGIVIPYLGYRIYI